MKTWFPGAEIWSSPSVRTLGPFKMGLVDYYDEMVRDLWESVARIRLLPTMQNLLRSTADDVSKSETLLARMRPDHAIQ